MSWVDMMSKENYISSDKLFEMFSSPERDVVDQIRRFGTIHIHGKYGFDFFSCLSKSSVLALFQ